MTTVAELINELQGMPDQNAQVVICVGVHEYDGELTVSNDIDTGAVVIE